MLSDLGPLCLLCAHKFFLRSGSTDIRFPSFELQLMKLKTSSDILCGCLAKMFPFRDG